jgi:hypothetical protein
LASKGATADWSDYANTTDSLEAAADTQATAAELLKVPKSDGTATWNVTALASINAEVDTALNTAIPGSPTADSINQRIAAIDDLTQAGGGGDLAAILTDTSTTLDNLIEDVPTLAELDVALAAADDAILAAITALENLSAAQVNAEMVDALNVDTYAEPGQGAPGATISLAAKIGYLYKILRNKKTQTADTRSVYNDAGDTVDQKATDSDDSSTFVKGKYVSGA